MKICTILWLNTLLVSLATLIVQSYTTDASSSWSQFHGNSERTGRSDFSGPEKNPVLAWKTQVGCLHWGPGCWVPGFTGTDSSPAVSPDGTLVYIGSYDHYLYAVNVTTGRVVWKRYTGEKGIGIESSPAVSINNIVVVGTYGDDVLAYCGDDGTLMWNYTTRDYVASAPAIAIVEGATVAFVGGVDGFLHAIDVSTGQRRWAFDAQEAIWAPPMVAAGKVCFGSGGEANPYANDHAHVHCVNASTGLSVWNYSVGSSQVQSCPTLDDRSTTLYVGVYDGRLLALDFLSGTLKWSSNRTGGRVESSPVTTLVENTGCIVVVGSADGFLYAFFAETGKLFWRVRLGTEVGSSPAIDNRNVIYVGGDPGIYAINASDGSVFWHYAETSGKLVGSSVALLDRALLVGGEDGYLYKITSETGPVIE
eukprot:g2242.t1